MTNHKFLLTVWFTFFNDLGGGLAGQSLVYVEFTRAARNRRVGGERGAPRRLFHVTHFSLVCFGNRLLPAQLVCCNNLPLVLGGSFEQIFVAKKRASSWA